MTHKIFAPSARAQRLAAEVIFAFHGRHAAMLDSIGDDIANTGETGSVILALAERIDPAQVTVETIDRLVEIEAIKADPNGADAIKRNAAIDRELNALLHGKDLR